MAGILRTTWASSSEYASIVNVGSTAFLRYSRVFLRADAAEPVLDIPVAVITDLDVPEPEEPPSGEDARGLRNQRKEKHAAKVAYYEEHGGPVKAFVSPRWTLEFELGRSSIRRRAYKALLEAKAIRNSKSESVTKSKAKQIDEAVAKAMDECDGVTMAKTICAELAEGRASKAVMAQCLAKLLSQTEHGKMLESLRKSKALSYLVEAIEYVTEDLPDDSSDS